MLVVDLGLSLDICLASLPHDPCPDMTSWVSVEPRTPLLRFYPVVSSTDNRTQEVAIFTADPTT